MKDETGSSSNHGIENLQQFRLVDLKNLISPFLNLSTAEACVQKPQRLVFHYTCGSDSSYLFFCGFLKEYGTFKEEDAHVFF